MVFINNVKLGNGGVGQVDNFPGVKYSFLSREGTKAHFTAQQFSGEHGTYTQDSRSVLKNYV